MEVRIAIFIAAMTIASGLLFYVSRRVDFLEQRVEAHLAELRRQHMGKTPITAVETITLVRQLILLDRRQSGIQWMNRLLSFGYVTGYLFGAGGLLLLLLSPITGWSVSAVYAPVSIVAFLASASIIGNSFVGWGVWQACRRGMREATIVAPQEMDTLAECTNETNTM